MSYFYEGFYAACLSTFHLCFIACLGIVSKKMKFVSAAFTRSLSKAISQIILPCFIFAQIIRSFHISQYKLIFEAFIGCFTLYSLGYLFGYLSALMLGYSSNKRRFVGATFSSPHTTSIPIILLAVVGPVLDSIVKAPGGTLVNAERRGFLYIVLNSIFSNIWRWSGIYYLVQPEPEHEKQEAEPINEGYTQLPDEVDKTEEKEKDVIGGYSKLPDEANKPAVKKEEESMTCIQFIKEIMTVPVIASLATLSLTLFPSFQDLFITPGTLLNSSILSVTLMISKAYSFLVIMLLGLSLSDAITTDPEAISKVFFKGWELVFLSVCKLVIMPLVSAPLLVYLFKYLLKADDVMLFLFLFMSSAPSAINMIIICSVKGVYSESVSMLMVAMYGIGVITLTLGTTGGIYLLGCLNNVLV